MNNQVEGFMFPSEFSTAASSIQPWPVSATHSISPCLFSANFPVHDPDSFFSSVPPDLPPPPAPPSIYGDLYSQRGFTALQSSHDHGVISRPSSHPLGFGGLYMASSSSSSSSPFGSLHAELISKMSAQEIMDAKALAASRSHSEAERRRRERINAHLAKLRSLLPSTTKTDKASLLAEVIQHVRELKRQTSDIAEDHSLLPTEVDELTVDATWIDDGKFVVRASLCCEDRSDLIPDLIKALKALKLRTLKADITTLGGKFKNILVVTGEDDQYSNQQQQSISSIQDALKAVMERTAANECAGGIKRQRTNNLSRLLQQRS